MVPTPSEGQKNHIRIHWKDLSVTSPSLLALVTNALPYLVLAFCPDLAGGGERTSPFTLVRRSVKSHQGATH